MPVEFTIPATTLSQALITLAKQAKLSVIVAEQLVRERQSSAVSGLLDVHTALQQLLDGTGLSYRFTSSTTVVISASAQSVATVTVTNTPAAREDSESNDLAPPIDNIIVTALRRRADLQKTAAAVSVLDQQALRWDGINSLEHVSGQVPGLTVSSFSLGQPTIHMRGIGSNDDGAAMDQSVVVFIDDVYVGRITSIDLDLIDLARVEVLRGSQGALYGKNVIGGAIKLISHKPTVDRQLSTSMSVGNYQHRQMSVLANGAMHDKWLGRLAVRATKREGWQDNIVLNGPKQHNDEHWAVRAQMLYAMDDAWEYKLSADASQHNLNSTGRIPIAGRTPVTVLDESGQPIALPGSDPIEFQQALPSELFRQLGGDLLHATNSTKGYTDNSGSRLPSYRLFDVNAHFTDNVQQWELSVWAKNLLDERYISHVYVLGGNDYALVGTPRTFGVTLTRNVF